mmetsp:Transcript_83107/g.217001  ORF Transcript_83107/g.217001 Transcript_83107/m.217001 type:complete len:132 (-) Transcript_83107:615-1010(-)
MVMVVPTMLTIVYCCSRSDAGWAPRSSMTSLTRKHSGMSTLNSSEPSAASAEIANSSPSSSLVGSYAKSGAPETDRGLELVEEVVVEEVEEDTPESAERAPADAPEPNRGLILAEVEYEAPVSIERVHGVL